MRFEIINPSDPYTMESPDLQIAAVAVCLLGDGKYGLSGLDGAPDVPIFLLGGHDEWFTAHLGRTFEATAGHVVDNEPEALALALDSVTLGRAERSSMNNIGARAKALAKAVRAAGEPAKGK